MIMYVRPSVPPNPIKIEFLFSFAQKLDRSKIANDLSSNDLFLKSFLSLKKQKDTLLIAEKRLTQKIKITSGIFFLTPKLFNEKRN